MANIEDNFFPLILNAEREDLTSDGALSVEKYFSTVSVSDGANMTLADGTVKGQLKKVVNIHSSGACEITVATPKVAADKVIDINAQDAFVILMWVGDSWTVVEHGATFAHASS